MPESVARSFAAFGTCLPLWCVPGPTDSPAGVPELSPVWSALPLLVAGPVGSPADVVALAAESALGEPLAGTWAKAGMAMQMAAAIK